MSHSFILVLLTIFILQCFRIEYLLIWRNEIVFKVLFIILLYYKTCIAFFIEPVVTYWYSWFRYLVRFEHELNAIKSRHKDKNNRRFASREDVIRHTMEREREEYNTAGIGKAQHIFINEVYIFYYIYKEIGKCWVVWF